MHRNVAIRSQKKKDNQQKSLSKNSRRWNLCGIWLNFVVRTSSVCCTICLGWTIPGTTRLSECHRLCMEDVRAASIIDWLPQHIKFTFSPSHAIRKLKPIRNAFAVCTLFNFFCKRRCWTEEGRGFRNEKEGIAFSWLHKAINKCTSYLSINHPTLHGPRRSIGSTQPSHSQNLFLCLF